MLGRLGYRIALGVRSAALRLVFAVVAAGLIVAGLVFLGVALWLTLEARGGTVFAAGILGGVALGLGFVILAVGVAYRPRPPVAPPLGASELMAAFMSGYTAAQGPGRAPEKKQGDGE